MNKNTMFKISYGLYVLTAKENGFDITGAEIIDPANYDKFDEMVATLCELRKSKGMTPEDAAKTLSQANYFGTMLVKMGLADSLFQP